MRHFSACDLRVSGVRADFRVRVLDAFAEGLVGGVGLTIQDPEALCVRVVAGPFFPLWASKANDTR